MSGPSTKQGLHRIFDEINNSSDLFGCEFHWEIDVKLIYIYRYINYISIGSKSEVGELELCFLPASRPSHTSSEAANSGPSKRHEAPLGYPWPGDHGTRVAVFCGHVQW